SSYIHSNTLITCITDGVNIGNRRRQQKPPHVAQYSSFRDVRLASVSPMRRIFCVPTSYCITRLSCCYEDTACGSICKDLCSFAAKMSTPYSHTPNPCS